MGVRVLGSSPSVQRPGRACSSYLVRTRDATVALDLGSGALGNLNAAIEYPRVDAVVVSHMHADHFLDVVPLRYGLKYGPLRRERRMPLWLPPGGVRVLRTLCGAFVSEGAGDFLDEVFDVAEYAADRPLEINDLRLTFGPTRHYIRTYAIRAERDGVSVVYSADTAPCESVVEHARDCSLFLCEATLGLGSEESPRGHSSAREAGEMARRAGAGELALTHYGGGEDASQLAEAAGSAFGGRIRVADDGLDFAL